MRRRWRIFFLLLILAVNGSAQDITESPTSTVKSSVQLELATSFESFKEGAVKNEAYTIGSILFLYGLSDNIELRLGTDLVEESTHINGMKQDDVLSGHTPFTLGFGVDLVPEKGHWPMVTVIADIYMPSTGGNDFRDDKFGGVLKGGFFHNLGKKQKSQLNYNIGLEYANTDTTYLYTMAYLHNIGKMGGAYFELTGDFPDGATAGHFWNAGLYFMITPKLQFDAIIGTGIVADQDIYYTARFAFTIPNTTIKK